MTIRSDIFVVAMMAFLAAPASAAIAPVAMAPDGAEPQLQQQVQDEANYSDEELKSFVVAVIEVHRINQDYLNKLGGTTSREEQERCCRPRPTR